MSDKLLITPYYGEFPNYFQLWLNRIKSNLNLDLLLVTDSDLSNYDVESINIKIVNMTLSELREAIEEVVGQKVKLNKPYKVNDYRPLFGEVFFKYGMGYEWLGTLDADVILGDTSQFLTNNAIDHFDKVIGNGHFTIWKNNSKNNGLWRNEHQNLYNDMIPFDVVRSLNANAAFDEYGWNWGKGISTFMEREGYTIENAIPRADLDFSYNGFYSKRMGKNMEYLQRIRITDEGMFAVDKFGNEKEIMYAHFQKRSMSISNNLDVNKSKFDIVPNRFVDNGEEVIDDDLNAMRQRFDVKSKQRVWKTKKHNLFSDYLILRLVMLYKSRKF